jgi:purine-binding chemotaxis protein CheW
VATAAPYVLFELGGTAYALPSDAVLRMEMVEHVTPVPNAPAFVDGVVFSRGRVVPVVNLRRRFGFDKVPYDLRTRLIVVGHADRVVGLIVDSAREFVEIAADAVQPPPEAMGGTSGHYLAGIATLKDKVILIVDVGEVLNYAAGPTVGQPTPLDRTGD